MSNLETYRSGIEHLIRKTTPNTAASFLKSCFLAQGDESQIWSDSATEFCRRCLTLILLTNGDYSLAGLFEIATNPQERMQAIDRLEEGVDLDDSHNPREFMVLALATSRYFTGTWDMYDEKSKTSIILAVSSILSPFSHK